MSSHKNQPYDLGELKPVLYIFGSALTLMGIAGLIALGVTAWFTWFLLAGGLALLAVGYFSESILEFIAGMPGDETEEQAQGQRSATSDTVAARKAS